MSRLKYNPPPAPAESPRMTHPLRIRAEVAVAYRLPPLPPALLSANVVLRKRTSVRAERQTAPPQL